MMRHARLVGLLVLLVTGWAVADGPVRIGYGPGRELAKLADPNIKESSGLAVARVNPGAFWTHNDSGGQPRLFLVDTKGKTLATMNVGGAQAVDWEDMASFVDGGRSALLIADVGDNAAKRKTCTLYVVREPWLYPGESGVAKSGGVIESIVFGYEGGPVNCESVAVDPTTHNIYLVSRALPPAKCKVYELPWPKKDRRGRRLDKGPYTAKAVATLAYAHATAMDISPDGLRCVVLTWKHAYEYVRGPKEPWAAAFARGGRKIVVPARVQGESLCYGADGRTLYLTSEAKGADAKQNPAPLLEVPVTSPKLPPPVTLTVYNTGDIHEHTANLARASQYVKTARELDPNVLFLDAGDLCGGNGEKEMAETHGEGMWSLMAAAGYDAGVLGNHDYNKGINRLEELCRKYPKFPLLWANVQWTDEMKQRGLPKLFPPYKIIKLQGLTVAVIGVGSHDLRYSKLPAKLVYFAPPAVKKLVPVLRKQADVVVAITHQYEKHDYWGVASYGNHPDLIVGGHSHGATATPYGYGPSPKPSFLLKAGPYIKALGAVRFTWDGKRIIQRVGDVLRVEGSWPEDPAVKALRDAVFEKAAAAKKAG